MAKAKKTDLSIHLKQLLLSTGKAAWITSSAFLVLVLPWIISSDREQQQIEFENSQVGAFTGATPEPTSK